MDSDPLRITIVTETFPPEVNGVAMTLHRLATGLQQKGHAVSIVRPSQNGAAKDQNDFKVLKVPGAPIPGYPGLKFGLPCGGKLKKVWRETPPDIIYAATEGPLGLSSIRAAKKLGIPVTSGFHTNFNQYMDHYTFPGMRSVMTTWLRWFHNQTRFTFTPSPKMVADLEGMGIQNVKLLGRGVDTRLFHPDKAKADLRQEWRIAPEGAANLFVSRIAAEKNLQLTAEAFQYIEDKLPGSASVWVGDGPERKRLEKAYPNFNFAGMRLGEELAQYFASGDLFIFASTTETFGNVVTEAMASGLVVIAYNYAAPQMVIEDGVNGFLAPFDNRDGFFQAIDRALQARDRWNTIREAARVTAESLTWEHIVDRFVDTLREARGETEGNAVQA